MTQLVPNRFLFDFEFPICHRAKTPSVTGRLMDWSDEFRLPDLCVIDGEKPFAKVWACWNESGISFACRVEGRRSPLVCRPATFWRGDNVRLCTDMRDTRNIKRASRYCQQFYLLPTGGGRGGKDSAAASHPINRAQENAPVIAAGRIPIAANVTKTTYALEAHLPAEVLSGFNPAEHPRIGFYYIIEDRDLGKQYPTIGDDLNWHVDPSTWPTGVLTR